MISKNVDTKVEKQSKVSVGRTNTGTTITRFLFHFITCHPKTCLVIANSKKYDCCT